jgi:hypothetical protein
VDYLALEVKDGYTEKQVSSFSFRKLGKENDELPWILWDCAFTLTIPQRILDARNNRVFEVPLCLRISLGYDAEKNADIEETRVSMEIDGKKYEGAGGQIDAALDQIREQWNGEYAFKNCYGCMYGDYHTGGRGAFGTMLCFCRQKEAYLNAETIKDYQALLKEASRVQEVYYCKRWEARIPGTGYRG